LACTPGGGIPAGMMMIAATDNIIAAEARGLERKGVQYDIEAKPTHHRSVYGPPELLHDKLLRDSMGQPGQPGQPNGETARRDGLLKGAF
jgi:hypothetical protein